jgi:gamma-tubulin complex component 3
LIYAIQNEIDEYYKLMSLLKKINNNDLSGKINHIPLNDSSEELKKYPKKLNLKNLFMGVISYKEKLKWLLTCCENVSKLKGSNVLSQIYSYAKYLGNKKYLNNVLNEVSKSFICFILNWIKYGEVQDPYSEFFVKINNEEIKDDEIWKEKYKFILNNIPNFVKREPIIKIFEIGKCIHFIRNYCKERYNLYNLVKVIQYIIQKYSPIINKNEKSEDDINMIIDDKVQNNIKNDED